MAKPLKTIHWAIIGTGQMARHFAQDIQFCPQARCVSVYSRSPQKAKKFAQDFENIVPHTSLNALLHDPRIDALYIATPNHSHFALAETIIKAKKPLLIEKPITITTTEAQKLHSLAQQEKSFLMEALWTRYLPLWHYVKQEIHHGTLGKIQGFEAELAFHHPFAPEKPIYDPTKGGGSLRDLGVYPLSLAQYLFGPPHKIQGQWHKGKSGVDVKAQWHMHYMCKQNQEFSGHNTSAIDHEGKNCFFIKGQKGNFIILPPFINAKQLVHFHGPLKFLAHFFKNKPKPLKALIAMLQHFAFLAAISNIKVQTFDFPSYGLQFEINAASKAIAQGLLQEPTMPMSESIQTLALIEDILNEKPL